MADPKPGPGRVFTAADRWVIGARTGMFRKEEGPNKGEEVSMLEIRSTNAAGEIRTDIYYGNGFQGLGCVAIAIADLLPTAGSC